MDRRGFLAGSVVGAVALGAVGAEPAARKSMLKAGHQHHSRTPICACWPRSASTTFAAPCPRGSSMTTGPSRG